MLNIGIFKKALIAITSIIALSANAAVIDFSDLDQGNITSLSLADLTVEVISANARSGGLDEAWIYNTQNSSNGDPDLNGTFDSVSDNRTAYNAGNILIIQEDNGNDIPDDNATGGVIEFKFDRGITLSSIDYFDTKEDKFVVSLFDKNGDQIGSRFRNPFDADTGNNNGNKFGTLSLGDTADVWSMKVKFRNASGGLDNIVYSVTSPVPEASTIAMMLSGLGVVGFMARRKKK